MKPNHAPSLIRLIALTLVLAPQLRAELAVTANDNKVLLVNGVTTVVRNPVPDTVSIIDLSGAKPRVIAEVEAPCSVIGPPFSVALTPDEGLALVTSAMKIDPADPTAQIEDNRVSVIDLKAAKPRVIATLEAGKSPAGVSINAKGTLALVANRGEGSISVFSIDGKTVTNIGKLQIADAAAAVCHATFSPDGTRALVARDGDHTATLVAIDGTKVSLAGRDIRPGLRPYGVDISHDAAFAVTGNVGFGSGDMDTVGVIDMRAALPRVIDLLPVAPTPEGIKLSPDGTLCGVASQNGSNKPKDSPFYADHGVFTLFKISGQKFTRVGEAPIGHWSQGVAFSKDNHTVLVTNMVEQNVQVFHWDGSKLTDTGERIAVHGGPVAIRTAAGSR
jgi:DNA-binding beta-propeller fold protein YncE